MTSLPFDLPDQDPLSLAELELMQWLKKNKESLQGKDACEVAYLAIQCGFEFFEVYKVLSYFTDAMAGSSIHNRAAFHVWTVERAITNFQTLKTEMENPKGLDLAPYWKELVRNTQTGEDLI